MIHLWAYIGISVLVILTPGPDTVLTTKNAVLHGRGAAVGTALGVTTGLMVWTVAAALGIAAIVRASAVAFTVLKLVGAIYLTWLGVQALRMARRHATAPASADPSEGRQALSGLRGYRQGVLSNLANPKIAVFFTSLLPQFVSSRSSTLVPFLGLGSIFVLITAVWLLSYALVAARISAVLTRPRVRAAMDRVTGVVLVGLGVRLALERR